MPLSFFLVVAHFVCPLIFFTNFTRNPYQTQITLLNLAVVGFFLFYFGTSLLKFLKDPSVRFPFPVSRFTILVPLLVFSAVCLASWIYSYFEHPPFFRPSIFSEGLRTQIFWLVNVLGALGIGWVSAKKILSSKESPPLFDIDTPTFIIGSFFALAWIPFRRFSEPHPPSVEASVWSYLWDPYGALLWVLMAIFLAARFRRKSWNLFVTLNFLVGFLASAYAVGQYFGFDVIWPKTLDAYGARAVSTFGNPNFLSSYLAILLPWALTGFLMTRQTFWGVLCLVYEAGLLVTLTRSSWFGALAGSLFVMAVFYFKFKEIRLGKKANLALAALMIALFFFWPQGVGGVSPKPLERVLEAGQTFRVSDGQKTYQPSFQRFLIWSSLWKLVRENPILGKGWGTLELFYPFYQGDLLTSERFRHLRTHANNAHNEIFEIWSQTGSLGLIVFIWFFAVLGFFLWRNLGAHGNKEHALLAVALGGGIIAMLADNMLNVSLHFAVPAYLFWWCVGLLIGVHSPPYFSSRHSGESRNPESLDTGLRRYDEGKQLFPKALAGFALLVLVFFSYTLAARFTRHWLSEFYYFRGFILNRESRLDLAQARLLASYRYFPMEVNKNYELGNVYARLGDRERALWGYSEALKANAGYDEIYFNRGSIFYEMGDLGKALENYYVSLAVNPLNRLAYTAATSIFLRDPNRFGADAIAVLEQAARLFPEDIDLLNNLASFYLNKKDFLSAANYLLRALKINSSYAPSRKNLILAVKSLLAGGQASSAIEIVNAWRQIDPSIPPVRLNPR